MVPLTLEMEQGYAAATRLASTSAVALRVAPSTARAIASPAASFTLAVYTVAT